MKRLTALALVLSLLPLFGCKKEGGQNTVYTIKAAYFADHTVEAEMSVDYFNNTDTEITALQFNLFPRAFEEDSKYSPVPAGSVASAYPNGINYGGIDIISCSEKGSDCPFSLGGSDKNVLVIPLSEGVYPDERRTVGVKFRLKIPEGRLRLGYFGSCVNLGNWFPILCVHYNGGFYECPYFPVGDPFCSECADFKITLSVPGDMVVAAGGECVFTEAGERTSYVYEMKNYRDAAFVLGNFKISSSSACGVPVRYYYEECENPSAILTAVCGAIETFSGLFGEYAFESFNVVSTPFIQGGMEYPGIVFISDALPEADAITGAVHEAAHQWWYAAVGNNQWEHAFLDEGLAEYSTVIFYENNPAYGFTREKLIEEKYDEYRAFFGVFQQLVHDVDTTMDRKLDEFSGEYEYVEICYVKSALMLDEFRRGVGDARFFRGLKKYYAENKLGIAAPADLIAAFNGAGCDAEGFINGWIDGKVIL